MGNDYQLLDWDSEILGTSAAKLLPERMDLGSLSALLEDLREQNIKLVYWASDSRNRDSQRAAITLGGFLVDRKVTYIIDLNPQATYSTQGIESYLDKTPAPELITLAYDSGMYSRFKMDPKITQTQFEAVYRQWITNSTNKSIAKEVLVIKKDHKIVGMSTLGEKNKRGDIGLLAIDTHCRGEQLGTRLVNASLAWCVAQGYSQGQVVTQKNNLAACGLYEKCGYSIEKVENFYHFWL